MPVNGLNDKVQLLRRGLRITMPAEGSQGEPRYTTNTNEFFINDGNGKNVLIGSVNNIKFKDDYLSNVVYDKFDIVGYDDSLYISMIDANINFLPEQHPDKWRIFVLAKPLTASNILYDNTTSGLNSVKVKQAIDELNAKKADITDKVTDFTAGNVSNIKFPTTKAVKTYVDTANLLDEKLINKKQTLDSTDEKDYPSVLAVKSGLDLRVNKLMKIIGIDLQNDISLEAFKLALGIATQLDSGLLSAADKTHLDTLVALLNTGDENSLVNTIGEMLKVFENYPESTNLFTALSNKVDKVNGYSLTENNLSNNLKTYYDTAYQHAIIRNANPHQTRYIDILEKPTTLALSGIKDVYTKTEVDLLLVNSGGGGTPGGIIDGGSFNDADNMNIDGGLF